MAETTAMRAPPELEEQYDDMAQQRAAAGLGIWVFLATEVLFFGGLFASYTISRLRYAAPFAAASRETDVWWGTVETAVLLTSSLTMAWAVRAARLGKRNEVTWLIVATMLLGTAFFAIHVHEYYSDYLAHLIPGIDFHFPQPGLASGAELFFFLYYVMTLLHLLHLTIGVGVLAVVAYLNHRGHYSPEYFTPVEVSGLYWHFVDIVWIFLYPLFYLIARAGV